MPQIGSFLNLWPEYGLQTFNMEYTISRANVPGKKEIINYLKKLKHYLPTKESYQEKKT